jgi:hypothetical protein
MRVPERISGHNQVIPTRTSLPALGWRTWSSSRPQAKRRGGEALASLSAQASVRVLCGKGRSALCQLAVTCTLELDLHRA